MLNPPIPESVSENEIFDDHADHGQHDDDDAGHLESVQVPKPLLFLFSLTLYPIFLAIPSFATAPALVFVGLLMMKNITKMKFDGDIADSVGGFFAIIMMPFSNSIATGIMFGIISWVILKVFTGKIRDIHPIMWISFVLFVIRIFTILIGAA